MSQYWLPDLCRLGGLLLPISFWCMTVQRLVLLISSYLRMGQVLGWLSISILLSQHTFVIIFHLYVQGQQPLQLEPYLCWQPKNSITECCAVWMCSGMHLGHLHMKWPPCLHLLPQHRLSQTSTGCGSAAQFHWTVISATRCAHFVNQLYLSKWTWMWPTRPTLILNLNLTYKGSIKTALAGAQSVEEHSAAIVAHGRGHFPGQTPLAAGVR